MSGYAWIGIISSATVATLAMVSYSVMALPYLDNAPYLTDLRRTPSKAILSAAGLFAVFFCIFYLAARFVDQDSSGPLLIFAAIVISLPISLLIGSETWDRHNGHGMNKVPGPRAIAVATSIGLAELIGVLAVFFLLFQIG